MLTTALTVWLYALAATTGAFTAVALLQGTARRVVAVVRAVRVRPDVRPAVPLRAVAAQSEQAA